MFSSGRTLNNISEDNAAFLQGIPVSTAPPDPNDVLQYVVSTGEWTPEPISSLPAIESIQNIGGGDGLWANTTTGVASFKSIIAGTGITLTATSSDITINGQALPTGVEGDILNLDPSNLPRFGKIIEGNDSVYTWKNCKFEVVNYDDVGPSVLAAGTLSTNTMASIIALGETDTNSSWVFFYDPVSKNLAMAQEVNCIGKDFSMMLSTGNFIINNNVRLPNLTASEYLALDSGNNIITTTIPGSVNIYNSDGSLTGNRVVTLLGNKLTFGPQVSTAPALLYLDPASSQIGIFSYNGNVNIGDTTQTATNISSATINLTGNVGGGINIDADNVTFTQQANGVLKTTSGSLTANAGLADLSDVSLSSPAAGQFLSYSGSDWFNETIVVYKNVITVNGTSITAILDNIYISSGGTITIPTCGSGDIGRRISISASQLIQTTVIFPSGTFLVFNEVSYDNFQMNNTTGAMVVIVIGSNQYTFESITDRWGSAVLSFQPFTASMLALTDLQDAVITSPVLNQILKYNGSKWVNSNTSFSSNLIFGGLILNGSTLVSIYDNVTIMDITYGVNATLNMTITLATQDANDSSSMIWDILDYTNDSPGTWKYIQPRTTNNWQYYTYFLYVMNDAVNINKFYIGFQKGPSSNGTSSNTFGYYFNIYNYTNPSNYTFNVYTSPSYSTGTGMLGTTQTVPRQIITTFTGSDITTLSSTFYYNVNYRLNFQIEADVLLVASATGTLTFNLNGTAIGTFTKKSSVIAGAMMTFNSLNFGNFLSLINSGTLLQNTNNTITASVSSGTTAGLPYTVNVIQEL